MQSFKNSIFVIFALIIGFMKESSSAHIMLEFGLIPSPPLIYYKNFDFETRHFEGPFWDQVWVASKYLSTKPVYKGKKEMKANEIYNVFEKLFELIVKAPSLIYISEDYMAYFKRSNEAVNFWWQNTVGWNPNFKTLVEFFKHLEKEKTLRLYRDVNSLMKILAKSRREFHKGDLETIQEDGGIVKDNCFTPRRFHNELIQQLVSFRREVLSPDPRIKCCVIL